MNNNFIISSPKFDTKYAEAAVLELKYKNNNKPLLIASIYISPDQKLFEKKIEELKIIIQNFIFTHEIILSGDWNAKIPKKDERMNRNYQIIVDWLQEEPSLEIIKTKNPTRTQLCDH